MSTNENSKIQLLVDNECSHETRAKILNDFDREPRLWRSLALALLEEQQWTSDLKSIAWKAPENNPDRNEPSSPPVHLLPVHSLPVHLLSEQTERSTKTKSDNVPWVPALAASILLAVGFYGGMHLPNGSSSSSSNSIVDSHPTSTNPIDYSSMKMVVTGPDLETEEVPIYDEREIGLMWAKENLEIARANERLRKQGFELDVRPEYYTGKMNDGRQLIVPVKHVGLKPYGL